MCAFFLKTRQFRSNCLRILKATEFANNFCRFLIENRFSERIIIMSTSSSLNLLKIANWREIAVEAAFQARGLAKVLKMHPRNLQREFQKQFHTTPQRYLDRIRIDVAKEMIHQNARTKEIGIRLGYKHESHLCRQFLIIAGIGIKEFRLQMANVE